MNAYIPGYVDPSGTARERLAHDDRDWQVGTVIEEEYRFSRILEPGGGRARLWLGWCRGWSRLSVETDLPSEFDAIRLFPVAR